MSAYESWRYGDPARVYERIEETEQRRHARSRRGKAQKARIGIEQLFAGEPMTQDESDEIEALLDDWYAWTRAQREFLGYSRVSPMFRDARSTDVHATGADVDDRLNSLTAEIVETCMSDLKVLERAAIEVHLRNKVRPVHRSPRLGSPEEQHTAYQLAKEKLFPLLKRKGLVGTKMGL